MITALTIAEPVAAWLRSEPRRLRVHSTFPQAINLGGDDSDFLTLVAQDADDGPFTVRLACSHLPDVPAGIIGHAAHGTIALGGLRIDWQPATRWDPTLKPIGKAPGLPVPILACLHESDSLLARALLALSPALDPSAFQAKLAAQAAGHLAALHAGLQGDEAALAGAVHSLLGFGQGLTPAGDDCLLGVLAARRMSGEPAGLLQATILASTSRTTSLSAAFLRDACDGQFASHWHRLRDALAEGRAAEVEGAVRRILTHGATSGADAMVGWVVGLAGRRGQGPCFFDLQLTASPW